MSFATITNAQSFQHFLVKPHPIPLFLPALLISTSKSYSKGQSFSGRGENLFSFSIHPTRVVVGLSSARYVSKVLHAETFV